MPFNQNTFLGASVRSIQTSLSLNAGQASQLTLRLAEDPANGDSFGPKNGKPTVNTPVYFQFENFTFGGYLQSWQRKNDVDGLPTYEAVLVDPRDILEGVPVVTGGYNGSVGAVSNILNVFGYWENQAYGSSFADDTGMPWPRIRDAILAMVNSPAQGPYGGPLNFAGYKYGLDLRALPSPPMSYRLPGPQLSLKDAIAQVCEDGGCDWYVELVGSTITIRTINRRNQPPLGTIAAITNANFGLTVRRSSYGEEGRNELTSSFLVGGAVTDLHLTDSIISFWGYDFNGDPILGTPDTITINNTATKFHATIPTESFNLNAQPVSDITGTLSYPCNTIELRFALTNMESWQAYVRLVKPAWADRIGINSTTQNGAGVQGAVLRPDLFNDSPDTASATALLSDLHIKELRMYEFVKGVATDYLGKKYLASLPFVLQKVDATTLKVTNSYDIADGGYLPDGSDPLGMSALNQDQFQTPDGRFKAFVSFSGLAGTDMSKIPPQGTVIEDDTLFMECNVDSRLIFTPSPYALITLGGTVQDEATDTQGDLTIVAAVLQLQAAQAQPAFQRGAFGNVPMKIAPDVHTPNAVAVPIKSNVLTYGPWFIGGAPGKVKFDQDESLTPWGYGGFDAMNAAGFARVTDAITNMQVSETGQVEQAGPPTQSLGGVLHADGPNITGMDVSWGEDGVTTTYRFQTYTPRFGVFTKGLQDRIRRIGTANYDIKRSLRASFRDNIQKAGDLGNAVRTATAFMQNAPPAIKRQTPHDVLVGCNVAANDGTTAIRVGVSACTMEESMSLSHANESGVFPATSAMSWSGLLRPFCTQPGGGSLMSSFVRPTVGNGAVPSVTTLNPWRAANDIEVYTWGDTYQGLAARRRSADGSNARPLALRGPLVVSGWGYAADCTYVPGNDVEWNWDLLIRSDKWKTGPVDLLWDEHRGVWTCHGKVKGITTSQVLPGSSGTMLVQTAGGDSWPLSVWNWFSTGVSGSVKVVADYIANDNRYYITAADCSS